MGYGSAALGGCAARLALLPFRSLGEPREDVRPGLHEAALTAAAGQRSEKRWDRPGKPRAAAVAGTDVGRSAVRAFHSDLQVSRRARRSVFGYIVGGAAILQYGAGLWRIPWDSFCWENSHECSGKAHRFNGQDRTPRGVPDTRRYDGG